METEDNKPTISEGFVEETKKEKTTTPSKK